jgi:hypothetical protein
MNTCAFFMMALFTTIGFAGQATNSMPSDAGSLVSRLAEHVSAGKVSRMEVVYYPVSILTRADLSPALLETTCHFRLVISREAAGANCASLVQAMTATKMSPRSSSADFRWGCSVYDKSGVRTFSLYLDGFGKKALVDEVAVTLDGPLNDWFPTNFGKCFDK